MQKRKEIATLPGVFSTVAAGFDLTAKHLWLLILPILLDIFYWLGPRLKIQAVIEQMLAVLPDDPAISDLASQLLTLAPYTNLFTNLTVRLIGVPALMTGLAPEVTPLPTTAVPVAGPGALLLLFVVLTVVGLLLTAVYYTGIAYVVSKRANGSPLSPTEWSETIGRSWLRLLGLTLIVVAGSFIIYLPIVILSSIFLMLGGILGTVVLFTGPVLIFWLVLFLAFAPHGIVLNGRPVRRAMIESVQIVRAFMVQALGLLLLVFLLGLLLDWALMLADSGTWLTLVNITAHAFVSTALMTAVFIFYRDRYRRLFQRPQPAV